MVFSLCSWAGAQRCSESQREYTPKKCIVNKAHQKMVFLLEATGPAGVHSGSLFGHTKSRIRDDREASAAIVDVAEVW
jgi:hypothetical protein